MSSSTSKFRAAFDCVPPKADCILLQPFTLPFLILAFFGVFLYPPW